MDFGPGELFHYADIGFILLGAMVEKITGEAEDVYVQRNVFAPLGMTDTRYLPAAKACGPHQIIGTSIAFDPSASRVSTCPAGTWSTDLLSRIAPTARDEDTPGINPNIDHLLRGTVHDPTARRIGGGGRGGGGDRGTAVSRPRGGIFRIGSCGQGGCTGVTLWIDPASDTYVIVLANVIHQRGGPPIVTLSGDVATEAARALKLYSN
jgi:CubicO group peptidase (beta-lactamase class C family)